jgi:hypothetical protein
MWHEESAWISGDCLGWGAISWPYVVVNMANGKDRTMNAKKNAATRIARNDRPVTAEWLTAWMRNGRRRIEVLGWKRLAALYAAAAPGSTIRKAINAEARRCGYRPTTILALNAEE